MVFQINREAFPCPSKYIDGIASTTTAASHHGIMHVNEKRAPARHHETNAAMRQTDKQIKPTQNGQTRTQNRASAPSGFRKYPYASPTFGTSKVNARLCHNQIAMITATALKNGSIALT
ncbi:MAG: hypothetical protein WB723_18860 [Candidatus Acidiferrales bacterium]